MFLRVRVDSLEHANGLPGSFGLAWVHIGVQSCRLVHSGWRGFTRARIYMCLRVHSGSACVRTGARSGPRVHSRLRGFTRTLTGFIQVRLCSLSARRGGKVHSDSLGFFGVHSGSRGFTVRA